MRVFCRSDETAGTVLVEIVDGEHVGIGAATPSKRHDETVDSVESVLPDLLRIVEPVDDPHALARIERRLRKTAPGEAGAWASSRRPRFASGACRA